MAIMKSIYALTRLCLFFSLFFAVQFSATEAGDAVGFCHDVVQPKSLVLRQNLFCAYDAATRPVRNHTNTTQVSIDLRAMFLFFHDNDNTLDVHTWTRYIWTDEHLKWNKSDYDDIDTLQIPSSSIWVPDIELYSSADLNAPSTGISGRNCWLRNTGEIKCVIPTLYSARCVGDISNWPYDSHNCSFQVGSWTEHDAHLNVSLNDKGLSTKIDDGFYQNRDWELLSSGAAYEFIIYRNDTHPWIRYYFVLQRNSAGQTATVVIPALVIVMMSLIIFWLHPDSPDRVGLICVNLFCTCLYLLYLDVHLPGNGQSYPVILLFFRNALLLEGISLLITLFERSLGKASSYPPTWVSIVFSMALDSKVGRAIFILRAGAQGEGSVFSARSEDGAVIPGWGSIVFILDHVFFAIFAAVFFFLIVAEIV